MGLPVGSRDHFYSDCAEYEECGSEEEGVAGVFRKREEELPVDCGEDDDQD